MPIAIAEFWDLAVATGLLTKARCQQLQAEFLARDSSPATDCVALARWLVSGGILTRYQASVLAAGRRGGLTFGNCTITDRIEHGRLAGVFRAVHKQSCASLMIVARRWTDEAEVQAASAQLDRLVALKDPHLTRLHGFVGPKSQPLAVIDALVGQSLPELLAARRPSPEEVTSIGRDVARGLQALHASHFVHGQLTPENIWIEPSGVARILAFPLVDLPAAIAPSLSSQADLDALTALLSELLSQAVSPPPLASLAETSREEIAVPLAIESELSAERVKRAQRRSSSPLIWAGGAVVLLAIAATVLILSRGDRSASQSSTAAIAQPETAPVEGSPENPAEEVAVNSPGVAGRTSATAEIREIDDNGQTLWVSPTAGLPISLDYLPSGVQVLVSLRAAELLASDEGSKLWSALGPFGEFAGKRLPEILGMPLAEIEQLTIAFVPDDAGLPQAALVARTLKPIDRAALLAAWDNPVAVEYRGKQYFAGKSHAYYLPPEQDQVLAIAPKAALEEMLERAGPPLLRKGMEALVRSSDSSRQINFMCVPGYLLTDGQSLLAGDLEKLRDLLARSFDDGWQAVLVSAHLGEQLFLELRVVDRADKKPLETARELRAQLQRAGEQLEHYVATSRPAVYGRILVNRVPTMVQLLADYTRTGAEDRQTVLRAYLPLAAAHNLVLGADLLLLDQSAAADGLTGPAPVAEPGTVAAALAKTISLSFPRDTLEHCLELLAQEIEQPIVISGPDLQLEGITKNQSFALDERQQPAGDVLAKVLKLASPGGKLVYVIKLGDDGQESILVTTRTAAAKRGERLPAEFDAENPNEKR